MKTVSNLIELEDMMEEFIDKDFTIVGFHSSLNQSFLAHTLSEFVYYGFEKTVQIYVTEVISFQHQESVKSEAYSGNCICYLMEADSSLKDSPNPKIYIFDDIFHSLESFKENVSESLKSCLDLVVIDNLKKLIPGESNQSDIQGMVSSLVQFFKEIQIPVFLLIPVDDGNELEPYDSPESHVIYFPDNFDGICDSTYILVKPEEKCALYQIEPHRLQSITDQA